MRVGIRDAERLKVSRLPPHPSGLRPCPPTPSGLQPSPPDRGSRPSPLWGEGFGAVQIGRNSALCGTFGYIYWELWRSAPVGGRAAQGHPYGSHPRAAGASPRPTFSLQRYLSWVGEPWGFRRGHVPGNQRAGEGTRPYTAFTNSSAYRKRDRFWACPLKPRGEAELRRKFLCLLSFSKKVRGPGSPPGPLTCVCCKGEGEMGDMYDYWVR